MYIFSVYMGISSVYQSFFYGDFFRISWGFLPYIRKIFTYKMLIINILYVNKCYHKVNTR